MLTKADLEALALVRLDDARFLLQAQRPSSAYYLAGYAVELALKACIAKAFLADVIPDKGFVAQIYTHDLEALLRMTGLRATFAFDSKADPPLGAAWSIASKWTEASRYTTWSQIAAADLVDAVGDPNHGVLQWLKKCW
jgi:hypothetical protein